MFTISSKLYNMLEDSVNALDDKCDIYWKKKV